MKKRKSPVFHSRKRGTALRSFFVTLLGSAAIAVLGAGIWQLLDPVEYQPPLAPLTASALAASKSDQPDPPEEKDTPPPGRFFRQPGPSQQRRPAGGWRGRPEKQRPPGGGGGVAGLRIL